MPSLIRGHNILNAIREEYGNDIIFNLEETDKEVLFMFKAKDDEKIFPLLKPKTISCNRSPFSTKNLPKTKHIIPEDELIVYKKIVEKIPKNNIILLTHMTNNFIKSLETKKNTFENIKSDMALKGLKGKEYIHSIGKWNDYISYLEKKVGEQYD